MPALHVRDVPPEVVTALKQRAARHHRSLEGELRSILAAVARESRDEVPLPPLELVLATSASEGATFDRREIYGDAER